MQMSNGFTLERHGSAVVIRFARPEIRNPLSIDVLEELTAAVGGISIDVGRVVFTGSENVFASGANLREIADIDRSTAKDFAHRGQRLMGTIASLSAKTIAAVNGYCYGGALDLVLACNSRLASPNAEFCHPGSGLGIMTGWGGTQRLPRLIGEAAALEMFLTGRRVGAEEAFHIGLIEAIVEHPLSAAMDPYL